MGCVQSAPRKRPNKREATALAEEAKAARLEAQKREAALKAAAAEDGAKPPQDALPRRDTLVLKQAGQFDKLHEDALKPPPLRAVTVIKGRESMKLLEGFEQKEAQSRAVPELVTVEKSDLRSSKLFDKLKEYEENDKRAAAEPRLEKTFMQRQRENSGISGARSSSSTLGAKDSSLDPVVHNLAVPLATAF